MGQGEFDSKGGGGGQNESESLLLWLVLLIALSGSSSSLPPGSSSFFSLSSGSFYFPSSSSYSSSGQVQCMAVFASRGSGGSPRRVGCSWRRIRSGIFDIPRMNMDPSVQSAPL